MRKAILVLLAISLYANEIRISEVMVNPQGSEYENEYIELYNRSDDVIHINGWILSDGSGIDSIIFVSGPDGIPPGGYALILDPSYDLVGGLYAGLIPHDVSIWSISTDATFGSGGLSNSGESVIISDASGNMKTSMSWSEATENGYSWERVDLNTADSVAQWKQSLLENGTPGYENSVVLPKQDLAISSVSAQVDSSENQMRITVDIKNLGSDHAVPSVLAIRLLQHGAEWYAVQRDLPVILSGDSLTWVESVALLTCGWVDLMTEIQVRDDARAENDQKTISQYLSCEETPVILTELMPIPLPGEAEWVEIYNRSERVVNLDGWQISDSNPARYFLTDSSWYMMPGEYVLLSGSPDIPGKAWNASILQPSSFPSLNNESDVCELYSPDNIQADMVTYSEDTKLVEGRSLERLRLHANGGPENNWRISVDAAGSTPGAQNSLYLNKLGTVYQVELDPNPFLPGDPEKGILVIHLELPVEQALVSVSIYDLAGREIATPVPLEVVAHKSQLNWDGTASYGGIADTGLYICRLVIDDMQGQVSELYRKVYLIND